MNRHYAWARTVNEPRPLWAAPIEAEKDVKPHEHIVPKNGKTCKICSWVCDNRGLLWPKAKK